MNDQSDKRRKCWATVSLGITKIDLIKDPGMIPLTMHESYGFDSMMPLWTNVDYVYKEKYFSEIETPEIKFSKSGAIRYFRMFFWLMKNSKQIDVLNLFHLKKSTWTYSWIYKKINRNGQIYIHQDSDGRRLVEEGIPKLIKLAGKAFDFTRINPKDVLWGLQNKINMEKLKGEWPFFNMAYVPDGVWWPEGGQNVPVTFEDKDNIILTVARNGTPQKRTDILLEGFASVANDFPEWKLLLAGSVEESFRHYISDYFDKNPHLIDRVIFIGHIDDKEELKKLFDRAKLFCLTSDFESFGIVTIEAMSRRCFIIESDIPSNVDLTKNGKFGELFKKSNVEDFTRKLRESLMDEKKMEYKANAAYEYAKVSFSWEKVLEPVFKWSCDKGW